MRYIQRLNKGKTNTMRYIQRYKQRQRCKQIQ